MSIDAEFDTGQFLLPCVIVRTRRVARYRLVRMNDPMDSAPSNESGDVELNSQDEGLRRLYKGIELGFDRLMEKLSVIDGRLDTVPTKTADALAGLRGLSEGEGGAKANDLAVS